MIRDDLRPVYLPFRVEPDGPYSGIDTTKDIRCQAVTYHHCFIPVKARNPFKASVKILL